MINNKTKSWLLLIILAIIWGSSFILMNKSMFTEKDLLVPDLLTANEVASLRIFISGIIMIVVFFKQINFFLKGFARATQIFNREIVVIILKNQKILLRPPVDVAITDISI